MCILLRAPQYSTFACCLTPVLTLVVLLVMLDDIDDISFSKRRYFLIVSWMSISVYCIPTRDTHITRDMCMGIHISRGYTYHCDIGSNVFSKRSINLPNVILVSFCFKRGNFSDFLRFWVRLDNCVKSEKEKSYQMSLFQVCGNLRTAKSWVRSRNSLKSLTKDRDQGCYKHLPF